MSIERCENCGVAIGALEPAHLHGECVVCAACLSRLQPVEYAVPLGVSVSPVVVPVLIERTSKKYKKLLLQGFGLFVAGGFLVMVGVCAGFRAPALALLIAMAGFGVMVWAGVLVCIASFGAFWHHG
jgi:hypothetical protein